MLSASSPVEVAQRWRAFCRPGRQAAGGVVVLWFCAWGGLVQLAPLPQKAWQTPAVPLVWWGGARDDSSARDVRATWTPAAFALSTPAGFSHAHRKGRMQVTPPIQTVRAAPPFDTIPPESVPLDFSQDLRVPLAMSSPVFEPREGVPPLPRLVFSKGWESRQFSGVDLSYSAWTNSAWQARMDLRFDSKGIPSSVVLAQSSGFPGVDRRLARSVSGWRLLEPAAPRSGTATWHVPLEPSEPVAPK